MDWHYCHRIGKQRSTGRNEDARKNANLDRVPNQMLFTEFLHLLLIFYLRNVFNCLCISLVITIGKHSPAITPVKRYFTRFLVSRSLWLLLTYASSELGGSELLGCMHIMRVGVVVVVGRINTTCFIINWVDKFWINWYISYWACFIRFDKWCTLWEKFTAHISLRLVACKSRILRLGSLMPLFILLGSN